MKKNPAGLLRWLLVLLAVSLLPVCAVSGEGAAEAPGLTLDRVVILSRHNIRSPLSGSGSLLDTLTPHTWFSWTSAPSELSLRGGVMETVMGQYFRLRLEEEGLFPANWRPEEGEVRFYANAMQRTIATARYFSTGLLPLAQITVETHAEYNTMDPVFNPSLQFFTDAYADAALAQIAEAGGIAGLRGISAGLADAYALLMDVTDMESSEAFLSGEYADFPDGETVITLTEGKEPSMTGPIKTGTSVADALTLQYYEEPDAVKAAFGHTLTEDDWRLMHSIVDTYSEMLFTAPLVAVNVAHPLLREIRGEMTAEGRKFTFLCGHDSNVASVLAALRAEDYTLPETVEPKTPIGVKLVFSRWLDAEGAAFWKISLVYPSTEQLRAMSPLSLEEPPVVYPVALRDIAADENGLIAEDDLLSRFAEAIDAFDELTVTYAEENAA